MRRRARALAAAAALGAALAAAAGCNRPDLGRVQKGMNFTEVVRIMGEPLEIVRGEGVDTGRIMYVYPQGRVFFDKCEVQQVTRAEEAPTISERARELKEQR